jgi:hypothetical protein
MGNAAGAPSYDNQRSLAGKLASVRGRRGAEPLVLAFVSPACGLCRALEPDLREVRMRGLASNDARRARAPPPHLPLAAAAPQAEARGAAVARLDATDAGAWAPELLALGVDAVPCALLVDVRGRALCRTPPPRSAPQMKRALSELLAAAAGRGARAAAA